MGIRNLVPQQDMQNTRDNQQFQHKWSVCVCVFRLPVHTRSKYKRVHAHTHTHTHTHMHTHLSTQGFNGSLERDLALGERRECASLRCQGLFQITISLVRRHHSVF